MIIRLLIRLLLIGLLAYLVYTLWRSLLAAVTRSDADTPRPETGEPMVLDPQCGTHIPRSDALTGTVEGRTYHFCSRECRDAFCSRR